MPVVSLHITPGSTRDQRARVVAEFTDTLVRVLGKKPEHTHIVIQEVAEDSWGYAGMLTDAFRRSGG
jgi:4-oxalocrotonate tautomerase